MIIQIASSSIMEIIAGGEDSLVNNATLHKDNNPSWNFTKRPGMLYVVVRAVSVGTNGNADHFTYDELKKAYKTFIGKGVFVNHQSTDIEKKRGIIIDAKLIDNGNSSNTYVQCLMEINANAFPEFAQMIKDGHSKSVSMGVQVSHSLCSICSHSAKTTKEYCFVPDTLITMSDGSLKTINEIKSGDLILDAYGKIDEVIDTMARYVEEDIVELKVDGKYKSLQLTTNHPVLGYLKEWGKCHRKHCKTPKGCKHNKKNKLPEFLKSDYLNVGDYLLSPNKLFVNNQNLDYELAELLGYYIAEGNLNKQYNKNYSVTFSLNINEKETIGKRIFDIVKKFFNIESKLYIRENRCYVNIYGFEFVNFISSFCSGKANDKVIGEKLFYLNNESKISFLSAAIEGDGCYVKDKGSEIVYVTSSKNLVNQLESMALSLGYHTNVNYTKTHGGPSNRNILCDNYRLIIKGNTKTKNKPFGKLLELEKNQIGKNVRSFEIYENMAFRISNKKYIPYSGYVYNFETKNTHTYIANGLAVHNCDHIKFHKGGVYGARPVYEINKGLEFIECSFVTIGADSEAKVLEIIAKQAIKSNTDVRTLWAAVSQNPGLLSEYESNNLVQDPEEGMLKTDEGDVKNIETPSDKIETPEQTIIIKIKALVEEAALLKKAGLDNSVTLSELDRWNRYYKEAQINSIKNEFNNLMFKAEQEFKNNIDCSETLIKAEKIAQIIKADSKFYVPKEKKNPNVLELAKVKKPGKYKMEPDELQDFFKAHSGAGVHKNKKDKRSKNPFKSDE